MLHDYEPTTTKNLASRNYLLYIYRIARNTFRSLERLGFDHPPSVTDGPADGRTEWPLAIALLTTSYKQDAQLSQRDRAAGCVTVFAKSRRLELRNNILRTLEAIRAIIG